MTHRLTFASLALTLVLSACIVNPTAEPVTRAGWHLQTSGRTYRAPVTGAVLTDDLATAPAEPQSRRMRVISTAYRTAAASTLSTPAASASGIHLALAAGVANEHELQKADSLLTVLTAQNRAADTMQRKQANEVRKQAVGRHRREIRRKAFDFKPTNIKRNDTIFVNQPGVKLAVWLGANGLEFKIADGVLNKKRNGETTDASVRPGYDWQPYRNALLIVGSVAAVAILGGLVLTVGNQLKARA